MLSGTEIDGTNPAQFLIITSTLKNDTFYNLPTHVQGASKGQN